MSATCHTCGDSIFWAVTASGKRMPVNEAPDPKGLFLLDKTQTPPVVLYARATDPPGERFTSHFSTCPDRDQHKRK